MLDLVIVGGAAFSREVNHFDNSVSLTLNITNTHFIKIYVKSEHILGIRDNIKGVTEDRFVPSSDIVSFIYDKYCDLLERYEFCTSVADIMSSIVMAIKYVKDTTTKRGVKDIKKFNVITSKSNDGTEVISFGKNIDKYIDAIERLCLVCGLNQTKTNRGVLDLPTSISLRSIGIVSVTDLYLEGILGGALPEVWFDNKNPCKTDMHTFVNFDEIHQDIRDGLIKIQRDAVMLFNMAPASHRVLLRNIVKSVNDKLVRLTETTIKEVK